MSSGVGSFVLALFCAAKKISLSRAIASSSAAMLFSRPTNSCDTMCGNTMMSLSGRAGTVRRGAALRSLGSFLKNMKFTRCRPTHDRRMGTANYRRRYPHSRGAEAAPAAEHDEIERRRRAPHFRVSADARFLVINDE